MAEQAKRDARLLTQVLSEYYSGIGVNELARRHGIPQSTVSRWIAKADARASVALSVTDNDVGTTALNDAIAQSKQRISRIALKGLEESLLDTSRPIERGRLCLAVLQGMGHFVAPTASVGTAGGVIVIVRNVPAEARPMYTDCIDVTPTPQGELTPTSQANDGSKAE